jgi:hypothetical protein
VGLYDIALIPSDEIELPFLLYSGESIGFLVPKNIDTSAARLDAASFEIIVRYSISQDSSIALQRVEYDDSRHDVWGDR